MKFQVLTTLILTLLTFAAAIAPVQKSIVVTFPDSTSDSVVSDARTALEHAGGVITHEYQLIKGFAAKASAKALDMMHTFCDEHGAIVENDEMVTAQD